MAIEASWSVTDQALIRVEVANGDDMRGLSFAPDALTAASAEDTLLTILADAMPGQAARDACKAEFLKIRADRHWF